MKLIIFILVLILLFLYYKKYCNIEHFGFFDNFNFNLFSNDSNNTGPFYINGNDMVAASNDPHTFDIYNDKYWVMKSSANNFSDIFNGDGSNLCSAINVDPKFSNLLFGCTLQPNEVYNDPTLPALSNNIDKTTLQKCTGIAAPSIGAPIQPTVKPKPNTPGPTTPGPTKPILPSNFPPEIEVELKKYKLLGYSINESYNQYYLMYEHEITDPLYDTTVNNDMKFLKVKLYKYTLVKMDKKTPHVLHKIGAREKINLGDFVYLSYGVFQLGPFRIDEIL
jgi:hypothetical protein